MNLPDWISPVARYMLEEGLRNTLQISAIALAGSTIIGSAPSWRVPTTPRG